MHARPPAPHYGKDRYAVAWRYESVKYSYVIFSNIGVLPNVSFQEALESSMLFYGDHATVHGFIIRRRWDRLQSELKCCGSQGHTDWFRVTWDSSPGFIAGMIVGFPASCCDNELAVVQNGDRSRVAQSCVSYTLANFKERLQPYSRGCVDELDVRLR